MIGCSRLTTSAVTSPAVPRKLPPTSAMNASEFWNMNDEQERDQPFAAGDVVEQRLLLFGVILVGVRISAS